MRVAVIGGTGFIGSYIVDALVDAGHQVSLLVRSGSHGKIRQAALWRTTTGDIGDSLAIEATVIGCDAVIYCVGILRELPRDGVTFEALQFDGAARTIDLAKQNGVRRFLLMSANGVKVPGTPYQESKRRAEMYLAASGLDGTIFRPSVVFGDPHGQLEIATQLLRDVVSPPIPAVGFITGSDEHDGQVMMSPVHVEEVAEVFVRTLSDQATFGKTFALGGADTLSWTEMIRRVAAATGRHKWILPMPISLMRLAAVLFDWLPFFPVTRDQLTMLAENNIANSTVIESLLGRPPRAFRAEHLTYLRK